MSATNFNDRTFPIGDYHLNFQEFCQVLQQFPPLKQIAAASQIQGPFDGKINSIYRIRWESGQDVIFRSRISKVFRYEAIVKEKILYPLLDGKITQTTENLEEQIMNITDTKAGSYEFSKDHPPIVPVQNLLYYYEPEAQNYPTQKELLEGAPYPYITSIKEFLAGKSLHDTLQNLSVEEKDSPAIREMFRQAGDYLGKLHSIRFDAFYDKITEIGQTQKPSWSDLFLSQWEKNLADASQYPQFQALIEPLQIFFEKNVHLAKEDSEAVLFHNDYQIQNIIVKENPKKDFADPSKFQIVGIIDFDNWRIGPRAQDFVKMEYWSIQGHQPWLNAFYSGYGSHFEIDESMQNRIKLYKILWFLLVYAFEMDKVKHNEFNATVDARFPAADKYLDSIRNELGI